MQPLPLTKHEVVATLAHRVARAEALGLSREQAVVHVARQLTVDPVKVAALVAPKRGASA